MKFQNVKGTRDFYPEQMAVRNWLMAKWREVSKRNGFVEYDGPTFEYLDLYKIKSGEEIVSELYHFQDRGGRDLALRPEMTPTLARMVAAQAASLPKPIKWFCVPNFFRAERPQRGRLREFLQWNVDIITHRDQDQTIADAECILAALDFLREVGLQPDQVEMKISSRALLAQILDKKGFAPEQHDAIYTVLDKRDKLPEETFFAELEKLGLSPDQKRVLLELGEAKGREGMNLVRDMLGEDQPLESPFRRLAALFAYLATRRYSGYWDFDLGVVRGLAYYTGVVFEIYSKGSLKRALCGGGRYSDLLKELGGPPLSGVGFGMGDVIVLDQLKELGLLPELPVRVDFFVAYEDKDDLGLVLNIATDIRQQFKRSCTFSYKPAPLKKQMQEASEHNIKYTIIVRKGAMYGDPLPVKQMSTGRQEEYPLDRLYGLLQREQATFLDPLESDFAS